MLAPVDIEACCIVQELVHIDMSMNQIVYCGSPGWCVLTLLLKVSKYMFTCKAEIYCLPMPAWTLRISLDTHSEGFLLC